MCIAMSLRNTRKRFNRFLYFKTKLMSFKSPRIGSICIPSPKLFGPAQFVLKIPSDIFPGASIHWNISLGDYVLVYRFVPNKPSSLTDSVHLMEWFGMKKLFRGRIHHFQIAKFLVLFLRKCFMGNT